MPILRSFALPPSPAQLHLSASTSPFFISFHASPDPTTGKPWCPDVVAALPHLTEVFSAPSAPEVAFVDVGQKPEWKDLTNVYRTRWNVNSVPTLVRFELIDGSMKEITRLVEGEILDRTKLEKLVSGESATR
ncbi:hypothetical protein BDV18DRAFT_139604 [Aspergillus unguis]